MFRFEQLEVWRLAVDYAKDCYSIAREFPQYEQFALGDQLRRASISISNNIAEGSVGSNANFRKYIGTAIGSALETVNVLNFAHEIRYISKQTKIEMYENAERLIRKLRSFSKTLGD
jgi:four helix bundle protein